MTSPAGRDAVAALEADPGAPAKLLVSGGIGTGKSTILADIRTALKAAGRPVLSRPPRPGDPAGAAVLVDDAHLLDGDDLDRITELVADPEATVVVAAEPLSHQQALNALATALSRENPPVVLGALTPVEVGRTASAMLGAAPAPEAVRLLVSATSGLPFLLRPAIAATGEGAAAVRQAARFALIERLRRLDERLLDTLLVSSLVAGIGPEDVAAGLRMSAPAALDAVDRARASGLLEPSYRAGFLAMVHDSIAEIVGGARHHDVEVALLASQIDRSALTAELALRLAEHGLRDERLGAALTDLARRTRGHPARAARLYRAATDAGAATASAHLAEALALTGDCATAARLTDELLTSPEPAERAAAVRIAASIALHDGNPTHAHDLFRWLGSPPDAVSAAAATITALAVGDAAAVRSAEQVRSTEPPTSVARAARSITEGLLLSLDEPYAVAVARLSRALGTDQGAAGVMPDSAAALVTLAALHGGDPVRARGVIGRALRQDQADAIFVTHRHRLLLGWTHMQDGQFPAAAAAVPAGGDQPLHARDALWASALQTGIARRNGDTGAMQKHWYSALEVLAECSVDLFALLPLGELWVAAARMRQVDRLQHVLDEAFAMLAALGDPVLWSVPLHWAGVHAGILANAPDAVAPHGQALSAAAPHTTFAKVLAAAGRAWLKVLANAVDVDEVTAAARALAQFGHTSDATRLAGQAALQTADPRASQSMLQLARDLKQSVASPELPPEPSTAAEPVSAAPRPAVSAAPAAQLSDREREVGELLLQGLPYRDIGAQLFISAKTVEHHVARIRRRLGAESRSEMLSMLRAILAPSG